MSMVLHVFRSLSDHSHDITLQLGAKVRISLDLDRIQLHVLIMSITPSSFQRHTFPSSPDSFRSVRRPALQYPGEILQSTPGRRGPSAKIFCHSLLSYLEALLCSVGRGGHTVLSRTNCIARPTLIHGS